MRLVSPLTSAPERWSGWRLWALVLLLAVLTGCSTTKYTVDDGRPVNEALLGQIRSYGAGEKAVRQAIGRSAGLQDKDCDKQWELPFAVASSYGWDSADDRVAWARALNVDERVTLIDVLPDSGLAVGDRIEAVAGYGRENSEKMLQELALKRDAGQSFELRLVGGRRVPVQPFAVCRGYTRFAPPSTPQAQDYHWLMSLHPLEVPSAGLSEHEALWLVLWTQGLSEEGGARMKTYHYAVALAGAIYDVATLASGLKGAALAADAAMKVAQSAAANAATEILKKQLIDQATAMAARRVRNELTEAAQNLTKKQVIGLMQAAAVNRGSLGGVARVAATAFERADAWAWSRMGRLGADPTAAFTLHQKLIEKGLAANAMVLDPDRMAALNKIAAAEGKGDAVVAILRGIRPDDMLLFDLSDMPLASNPTAFSFEDASDPGIASQPYARGLIDAMLELPVETKSAKK